MIAAYTYLFRIPIRVYTICSHFLTFLIVYDLLMTRHSKSAKVQSRSKSVKDQKKTPTSLPKVVSKTAHVTPALTKRVIPKKHLSINRHHLKLKGFYALILNKRQSVNYHHLILWVQILRPLNYRSIVHHHLKL